MNQPPIRKTDSWRHQLEAYRFADSHRDGGVMLAMAMGTGKSKVVVDAVCNRGYPRTLIICPKSVVPVWSREFAIHAGSSYKIHLATKGTTTHKLGNIRKFLLNTPRFSTAAIVVINYESAWRGELGKWFINQLWNCVVLDESHRVKGPTSKVSKWVWKLGRVAQCRMCLTGTPLPHSPLDAFSQYKFLNPAIYGPSWHRFRNVYAIMKHIPGIVVPIVDGYKNLKDLQERFARIAYRVSADVLDLPPVQHITVPCQLCPKAMKIYRQLYDDFIADVGEGVVTAANALVRLLRMQQVTGGTLKLDDTGEKVVVDVSKREALVDIIDGLDGTDSVVVFGRFRSDLDMATEAANSLGRPYGEVSGRRNDLTDEGTMPSTPGLVLGVQIQSGGVGVDLTAASYAIYAGIGFSLGDYEQSLARLHRPGAERPVFFYHLICEGTVDERVYAALRSRKNVVESILSKIGGAGDAKKQDDVQRVPPRLLQ